jgi:hypothetical protein
MKIEYEEIRIRNPFLEPLVSELIEDPDRYHKMFSESILVGETLQVYMPANIVLLGPQGSGKTMILNLLRYQVLAKWLSKNNAPPSPLRHVNPFLGISINLTRASFHIFGRRSVAKVRHGYVDEGLDATCAADYLTHFLFREFLKALQFLRSRDGTKFRNWLQTSREKLDLGNQIAQWGAWYGYYSDCKSIEDLLERCEKRLYVWGKFLNGNLDMIPDEVWETKAMMESAFHSMGNALRGASTSVKPISLFVMIDQYEVLPELNLAYGGTLQRIVNSLIKARDPVVFYKIGARNYDWGQELRIWGAESRIEVQRDYALVNLSNVLLRSEEAGHWVFPKFAKDVAFKRMKEQGGFTEVKDDQVETILGPYTPKQEALMYFEKNDSRKISLLEGLSTKVKKRIMQVCGENPSPLELRLAGAWALQKKQRNVPENEIIEELENGAWKNNSSWRKERIGIALLQIASKANARKRYFGWDTVIFLAGSNITAFLMVCAEIWDMAAKNGVNPLNGSAISPIIQSNGVLVASRKWAYRDNKERIGGRKRFEVLSRLGPGIHDELIQDWAISNPGHSGFSLRESDLTENKEGEQVAKFIENAVSWAIFEERVHTPKMRDGSTRRKWYLNAVLSPAFGIPYIRVKEPFYATVEEVYQWIFGNDRIRLRRAKSKTQKSDRQLHLLKELPQ